MSRIKMTAQAKELPDCGCALQFSMETEIAQVEAATFEPVTNSFGVARGRRLIAVVNRHTRPGETHERFDLRLEGNPEAMEELAHKILEAIEAGKVEA